MDIISTMYINNKRVHEPIESTALEESLCKSIEGSLSSAEVTMFEDLQNEQFDNYVEKIRVAYEEGFRDAISTVNQLNNI